MLAPERRREAFYAVTLPLSGGIMPELTRPWVSSAFRGETGLDECDELVGKPLPVVFSLHH